LQYFHERYMCTGNVWNVAAVISTAASAYVSKSAFREVVTVA